MGEPLFREPRRMAPLPREFFDLVVERAGDADLLRCLLRAWWVMHASGRRPPMAHEAEITGDAVLMRALGSPEAVARALAGAVERGFLICARDGEGRRLYALNGPEERAYFEDRGYAVVEAPEPRAPTPVADIFRLYQENIGPITPLIADRLREAERTYPHRWIEEAFRIAVERNVRRWAYVESILERWLREGKDGEPGRHTATPERSAFLREFLRRGGTLPRE